MSYVFWRLRSKPARKMSDDNEILSEAKEAHKLGLDAERDNRETYVDDYRFARLDEHWPEEELTRRKREGRPCLVIPRLPAFLNQVINDSRQNRPRIRTKPVDSFADPKTAQVLDGLILNIEQASNAAVAYDTAIDCAVSGGFGYFRIDVEYSDANGFEKELRINRIANPLQVVGDPYSQAADSSDWNSCFITSLMTKDEFGKRYKGADKSSWVETEYMGLDQAWMSGDEIMLAEWWRREEIDKTIYKMSDNRVLEEKVLQQQIEMLTQSGITVTGSRKTKGYKVTQYLLTGAEVLKKTDWQGCFIPIIPVYGEELNIEGKRVFRSLIARAKDPQRRLNYWVSAATELVALAPKTPFIGTEKAFSLEPAKWNSVNTHTHPYIAIPNNVELPQRQPLDGGQALGAISQALAASDDIKAALGMFDASLGERSNETSGKAINARQRESDTGTFHFGDNLARSMQHGGKVLVDLIPAVHTPGSIVRVIGQDGRVATAKVENQQPGAPKPQFSPLEDDIPEQDETGNPIDHVFDFGVGRYDVVVETGPSYTTQRQESREILIELMRGAPMLGEIAGDLLIKNFDIPEAEEIAKRIKKKIDTSGGELPPEVQQMIQEGQKLIQEQGQKLSVLEQKVAALQAENKITGQVHQLEIKSKDLTIQQLNAEKQLHGMAMEVNETERRTQEMLKAPPKDEPAGKSSPVQINIPDNIADVIGQAVKDGLQALPPLQVNLPPPTRMKRTPVRDKQGMIMHTVDEPMQEMMS